MELLQIYYSSRFFHMFIGVFFKRYTDNSNTQKRSKRNIYYYRFVSVSLVLSKVFYKVKFKIITQFLKKLYAIGIWYYWGQLVNRKLNDFGIRGFSVDLIKSYPYNRYQVVCNVKDDLIYFFNKVRIRQRVP